MAKGASIELFLLGPVLIQSQGLHTMLQCILLPFRQPTGPPESRGGGNSSSVGEAGSEGEGLHPGARQRDIPVF
eukprot:1161832-Pelagomonas_calceolata.AAC.12